MIFTEQHLQKVKAGTKTQTRRAKPISEIRYNTGTVYRATQGGQAMFTPIEDCELFVKVTDMYEEQLGDITPQDCQREGGYTKSEFISLWKNLHGTWNPNQTVTVLCITPLTTHPSER